MCVLSYVHKKDSLLYTSTRKKRSSTLQGLGFRSVLRLREKTAIENAELEDYKKTDREIMQ